MQPEVKVIGGKRYKKRNIPFSTQFQAQTRASELKKSGEIRHARIVKGQKTRMGAWYIYCV